MAILRLPDAFYASQASFGVDYGGSVSTRRSGIEDVFTTARDRWQASFVIEPALVDMADWRLFLRRMKGPAGLCYVHDATNARPVGGARTAEAYAAKGSTAVAWVAASGQGVVWENDSAQAVTWGDLPAVPADKTIALEAAAPSGASSVRVSGLWPSSASAVAAGDYIQIDHWLYLAAANAHSDANGIASVRITPSLWRGARAGAPVKLECAATIMRLVDGQTSWSRGARDRRSPFRVAFREVLPTEGVPT